MNVRSGLGAGIAATSCVSAETVAAHLSLKKKEMSSRSRGVVRTAKAKATEAAVGSVKMSAPPLTRRLKTATNAAMFASAVAVADVVAAPVLVLAALGPASAGGGG